MTTARLTAHRGGLIDELCDGADYYVAFFSNEEELNAWEKWMEEPHDDGRPRIVKMNQETGK